MSECLCVWFIQDDERLEDGGRDTGSWGALSVEDSKPETYLPTERH